MTENECQVGKGCNMDKIQENIVNIAILAGYLIAEKQIDPDVERNEIAAAIVNTATMFEKEIGSKTDYDNHSENEEDRDYWIEIDAYARKLLVNEFGDEDAYSENYMKFKDIMTGISTKSVIEAHDYLKFREANDDYCDLEEVVDDLGEAVNKLRVPGKACRNCGKELYLSDLPQYDYVCIECNESFFGFEAMEVD